jgi:hypothetical protein
MAAKLVATSIAALSLVCAVGCGGPQKPADVPEGSTAEAVDEVDEAGVGGGEAAEAEGADADDADAPATSDETAPEEEEAGE